jgi:hypothetical protein
MRARIGDIQSEPHGIAIDHAPGGNQHRDDDRGDYQASVHRASERQAKSWGLVFREKWAKSENTGAWP